MRKFLRGSTFASVLGALVVFAGTTYAAEALQKPDNLSLWKSYSSTFAKAKYIDLTHAISPVTPTGPDFGALQFSTAHLHGNASELAFDYPSVGAGITAYVLPTDQVGTQLDPPAHGNDHGATISEFPATVAVRPLVVINMAEKTSADNGAVAQMADIRAWEAKHGPIPLGSVVMFRTDWYKRWPSQEAFNAKPFPGISMEVLEFLHMQRHILFHGHETYNTDMSPTYAAEKWLFHHNFAQAEGVANLDKVPESGALIAIGFAKLEGGTGGYARYVAIAPSSWPYGVTIEQAPGAPMPTHEHPLARDTDGVLRETKD